jgi:DNA invertase Pin-like site-specific DNA recombinase
MADLEDVFSRMRAVPYMRVSSGEQRTGGNLKNRRAWLRRAIHRRGIVHTKCFSEVVSGNSLQSRPRLIAAIDAARRNQAEHPDAHVVVVTDTRNRFLRGSDYNGQASTDPPNPKQLAQLRKLAGKVPLVTVLNPDIPFGEVRAHEMAVAKKAGKRIGRPPMKDMKPGWTKERREELLPEARRLHEEEYWGCRTIAKHQGVHESTLRGWLKRDRQEEYKARISDVL